MKTKRQRMKSEQTKVLTPEFRASFPNLFVPTSIDEGGRKTYSVTMLFQVKETEQSKKDGRKVVDLEPLRAAVRAVVEEKFGTDRTKWPPIGNEKGCLKLPFRDGTEIGKKVAGTNDYQPGYGAGIIFAAASKGGDQIRPGVVGPRAGADGRPAPIEVPTDIYGGCFMRATLNPYFWEYMGKYGVSLGIQSAQLLRDGEPFGRVGNASNDFDAIPEPLGTLAGAAGTAVGAGSDIGV